MKLFVSGNDDSHFDKNINVTTDFNQADIVLILPGGLGTFYDLFQAIKLKKKVIVYNKDLYYSSLFKNLFQGYEKGYIDSAPSEYISIESEMESIIKILEDLEK